MAKTLLNTTRIYAATGVNRRGKPPIRVVVADDHPIVREGIVANLEQQTDIKIVAEGCDG
jgi:hypothetical protein